MLLKALADSRLKKLDVWLLGEGIMRKELEAQAASLALERVRFTGQIEFSKVSTFLGAADFCLAPFAPSRGDVSPLKVIDYLFCGRPTVIADIPPVENLVQEFRSLLPFTAGDSRSLADALCTMIERKSEFADRAREDSQRAR